ncbi:GNAT family N-acetyltransferase [Paenibacillus sp. FSL H7-0350]|uniref:GNAT family N-acetyltransferase n=1 Tax=Paenibacillus sp. FSL H7-0350 TaxID=2975345 RepID=UPI00315974A3
MGEVSILGSLSITPLAPEDISSVSKLFKVTIADAFEREGLGHLQADIRQETAAKIQMANAALNPQDTDVYFWLARSGGVVIGTVSYAPCGEDIRNCTDNRLSAVGELGSLYVLPEFQGQGVGSALIEEVTVFLRKRGISEFCLDSGYKRAQDRWLRKFGTPHAAVQDYWGPDSIHMVWLCSLGHPEDS